MSSVNSVSEKHYFYSIDGLRLFAAVNVILFHYQISGGFFAMQGNPAWFFTLIKGPAFHASLFFILAGFIYTIKYAVHAHAFSTKKFIISRLKDLYPLHVVTTLAMIPFIIMQFSGTGRLPLSKICISSFMHLSMLWPFFPNFTYTLNTPSWALSAFFFCYILMAPVLKLLIRVQKKRHCIGIMILCCGVIFLWSCIYAATGFHIDLYNFFHIFAPIRFLEFVLGMLLARLFQIRASANTKNASLSGKPFANDLFIIGILILIYINLLIRSYTGYMFTWLSYHLFMPVLYCLLLYRFARGNGIFAKIFALKLVRQLGKASFYPYLLHIPVMSWICWISEHQFNYKTFLHSPLNIWTVVILLYVGSLLYMTYVSKRKPAEFKASD